MDRTSKLLLAAVAAGLFANAATNLMPVAWAADAIDVDCKVSGPMEVRVTSVDDEVELTWDFSAPGASSSSPLFVKGTD